MKYPETTRETPRAKPRWFVFAAAFMIAFVLVVVQGQLPLHGQSRSNLEQKKKSNASQLQRIREQLRSIGAQKKNMVDQIQKVDSELDKAINTLMNTKIEEQRIVAQYDRMKRDLEVTTEYFRRHRDRYRERLVSFYKAGDIRYLEILLKSESFSDFISRMHYLRLLAARDRNMLEDLRIRRERINIKKNALAEKKEEIAINRAIQEQDAVQIQSIKNAKQSQLKALAQSEDALIRQEQILARANAQIERDLAAMIARASRSANVPTVFMGGKFRNPMCNGAWRVTSSWGPRHAPKRGASSYHKGIDLAATYGQNVCAVADGTVIFVGYKGGYGKTVMVAHSQNLVTLYAHGAGYPPGIAYGVRVARGQVVLYADSSGVSTGNHLHFSVFQNNVAVNPMGYF